MQRSADVDVWFTEKHPAAEPILQRVRELILSADERVTERVQYGSVTFDYQGGLASFVQTSEKRANLMFHRGGRIKGDFPHLEGNGPSARFMRFRDLDEVDARAAELQAIVRTWCAMVAPKSG